MSEALARMKYDSEDCVEAVIYVCPVFVEDF